MRRLNPKKKEKDHVDDGVTLSCGLERKNIEVWRNKARDIKTWGKITKL